MFRKILSVMMSAVICIVGLSGCEKNSSVEVSMPEIVFVKFYWDYVDVITGEYIDKNGNIRSFEFDDEELYPELDYSYKKLSEVRKIYQYSEARNIKSVHELIMEHYKNADNDSIIKNVEQNMLKEYYFELLQVNTDKKLKSESFYDNMERGWSSLYGVRKNENNAEELVFIRDYGNAYLSSKEKHTENLFYALHTVFSQMEPMVGGW